MVITIMVIIAGLHRLQIFSNKCSNDDEDNNDDNDDDDWPPPYNSLPLPGSDMDIEKD